MLFFTISQALILKDCFLFVIFLNPNQLLFFLVNSNSSFPGLFLFNDCCETSNLSFKGVGISTIVDTSFIINKNGSMAGTLTTIPQKGNSALILNPDNLDGL